MVVGILAVLKTGGCYVPLDPVYPKERLAFILEDARPKLLLTDKKLLDILPPNEAEVVLLETKTSAVSERETENMNGVTASENLAYLIYTSGSTGKPKGVMITHGKFGTLCAIASGIARIGKIRPLSAYGFDFIFVVRQTIDGSAFNRRDGCYCNLRTNQKSARFV